MMPIALLAFAVPALPAAALDDVNGDDICPPTRLLSPPSVLRADRYGWSVTTNGRFWFVGDLLASMPGCGGRPLGCEGGAVHVYEMIDGQLLFVQTLVPDDLTFLDRFGASLDVDGDRLIVGSWFTDWPTTTGKGGAYIFEFDGDSWNQVADLVPPPDFRGDLGGSVVAIDGEVAAVHPSSFVYDKIHVYSLSSEEWTLSQVVEPPVALEPDASFGGLFDLEDQWMVATAYRDPTRAFRGGSAFVFRRDADGVYQFTQQILPPEPFEDTREFGYAVKIDGDTLAIGSRLAHREAEAQGAVFMYELEGDQWVFQQEVTHANPVEGDNLGTRLALDGDTLLSYIRRTVAGASYGVIRFQRGADGLWREVGPLIPTPVQYAGGYGKSMVVHGEYALLGAEDERAVPGVQEFPGAAYLFDLACGACDADLDADGTLTVFDFLTFLNLFDAGDPRADFDGDGELTIFDFLAFQTAFDAGCE